MPRFFFFLCFFSFLIPLESQGQTWRITGFITDALTQAPLRDVHVVKTSGRGTVSDRTGFFAIGISEDDTLTITLVGYEDLQVPLKHAAGEQNMLLTMKQEITVLDSVTIRPYSSKEPLLLVPKREPYAVPGLPRPKPYNPDEKYHMGVMGSLMSPATALYRMFSKDYKEEKEYYFLRKEYEKLQKEKQIAFERLETFFESVRLIVPESHYQELLKECQITNQWLLDRSDYEIYMRIYPCLGDLMESINTDELVKD